MTVPPIEFSLVAGTLVVAGLVHAARRPRSVVSHARGVLLLVALFSATGGPLMGDTTCCWRSMPNMLLRVARLTCASASNFGR